MTTLTIPDYLMAKKSGAPDFANSSIDMKVVASIILGGGEGTRLYPLTLSRCKPAISFAGKYRLIDVPISNSIHANCHKIFVLTQFLSSSLHQHIFQTYLQNGRGASLIEILTAEQTPTQKAWFQGTADAVRQNIDYLLESPVEYFLILSGDQLYNLDFRKMVRFAKETDADLVIASLPIAAQDASRMGVLKVNNQNFVTDFYEKPKEKAILQRLRSSPEIIERAGINVEHKKHYLGSMGIYLFKRKALADLLTHDTREDFGKHLIPTKVQTGKVAAFLYDGYWEDIGTVETFYQANMALTENHSAFNFYNEKQPIFSLHYDLPPVKICDTQLKQTLICEGTVIEAKEVSHSILGPRTVIHKGSIIRDTYIMGNDYYISAVSDHHRLPAIPHIGKDCVIQRAIIDKNAHIGNGVRLINTNQLTYLNGENIFIRDGIIIVPRGALIRDGFTI
jgi:glucose-1-phosphate adenylyltransferase